MEKNFFFAYGVITLFVCFVAISLIFHAGRILNLAYPAAVFLVSTLLFWSRRNVYVLFVWWIWLFTPEVRRIVDFQSGYHPVSYVMLSPILATLVCQQFILIRPYIIFRRTMLPFTMFGSALIYGLVLGAVLSGVKLAAYEFLEWFAPLGFAVYLISDDTAYSGNRSALLQALTLGSILTSTYGLYQYFNFPPWDQYWLQQSGFSTAGNGDALQVRLFGPLNAPLAYGIALMAPLIFALVLKGPVRVIAIALAVPAFGLSLDRSAWLGWLLAAILVVSRIGGKVRIRLFTVAALASVLAYPILTIGPISDALGERISTFSDLQGDASFQAREGIYQTATVQALLAPLGSGLGGVSSGDTGKNAVILNGVDSGFIDILIKFGWVGSAIVIWSIFRISLSIFTLRRSGLNDIDLAASGLYLAMLFENFSALVFSGFGGMTFWFAVALIYPKVLKSSVPDAI